MSASPVPNRRWFVWLALAFFAFVVYGSLTPFRFHSLPAEEAVQRFQQVLIQPVAVESVSDWAANVLLMVPLSFCLMGAIGVDRPRSLVLGDALLVLPLCLLTSTLVEFAQLFVPGRDSSLNDIVAQGLGAALGAALWALLGQKATDWARQLWDSSGGKSPQERLLPLYLALLLAVYLLPLDLTLSPAVLYRKLRSGAVNLAPFAVGATDPSAYAAKTLLNTLYLFGLGLLLPGPAGRAGRPAAWLLGGVGFVGLLHGLKLLVASRSFDVTDVLVGSLAVACGWLLGLRLARGAAGGAGPWRMSAGWRAALLVGSLAVLVFVTWRPFDFDWDLAGPRLATLPVLPWADMPAGQEFQTLGNVVEKFALYLPLGALLTTWRAEPRPWTWLQALLVGGLVALGLEAGQLVLASRTALVSDVCVETAGAVLGSLIARRLCLPAAVVEEEPDPLGWRDPMSDWAAAMNRAATTEGMN